MRWEYSHSSWSHLLHIPFSTSAQCWRCLGGHYQTPPVSPTLHWKLLQHYCKANHSLHRPCLAFPLVLFLYSFSFLASDLFIFSFMAIYYVSFGLLCLFSLTRRWEQQVTSQPRWVLWELHKSTGLLDCHPERKSHQERRGEWLAAFKWPQEHNNHTLLCCCCSYSNPRLVWHPL